jgi:hypothetical protein
MHLSRSPLHRAVWRAPEQGQGGAGCLRQLQGYTLTTYQACKLEGPEERSVHRMRHGQVDVHCQRHDVSATSSPKITTSKTSHKLSFPYSIYFNQTHSLINQSLGLGFGVLPSGWSLQWLGLPAPVDRLKLKM